MERDARADGLSRSFPQARSFHESLCIRYEFANFQDVVTCQANKCFKFIPSWETDLDGFGMNQAKAVSRRFEAKELVFTECFHEADR